MRLLSFFLILVLLFSMSSCAETKDTKNNNDIISHNTFEQPNQEPSGEYRYTAESIDIPEGLGVIRDFTQIGDTLYIAGSNNANPNLYTIDIINGTCRQHQLLLSEKEQLIYGIDSDKDNCIWLLVGQLPRVYIMNNERIENTEYKGQYSLIKHDGDGKYAETVELGEVYANGVAQQIFGMEIDENGLFYLWSDMAIFVFDRTGKKIDEVIINEGYLSGFTIAPEPMAAIMYPEKFIIRNPFTNKEITDNRITEVFSLNPCSEGMLINTGYELLEYTDSPNEVFSWIDLGVNGINVPKVLEISEDTYVCQTSGYELIKIELEFYETSKQVLTLASVSRSSELLRAVSNFNKNNDDYRIELITYEAGNNGLNRLITDIHAGNIPDIYDLLSINSDALASAGYLEDLKPFIEADTEFEGVLLESVLHSLENNGCLYEIYPTFFVNTVISGDELKHYETWNFKTINELLKSVGNKATLFESWVTKTELMYWIISFGTAEFIDWENGTCSFDNGDFIYLLELANSMSNNNASEGSGYINEENNLLSIKTIQNMQVINGIKEQYGENYQYRGFPSSAKNCNGSYFSPALISIGMSSNSEHKDAAWLFIKSLLQDDFLESSIGLPVNKNTLEKQISNAIDNEDMVFNEDDRKKLLDLINKTKTRKNRNSTVSEIIINECQAFFSGDVSAETAANNIQDRVSIYVSEIAG